MAHVSSSVVSAPPADHTTETFSSPSHTHSTPAGQRESSVICTNRTVAPPPTGTATPVGSCSAAGSIGRPERSPATVVLGPGPAVEATVTGAVVGAREVAGAREVVGLGGAGVVVDVAIAVEVEVDADVVVAPGGRVVVDVGNVAGIVEVDVVAVANVVFVPAVCVVPDPHATAVNASPASVARVPLAPLPMVRPYRAPPAYDRVRPV